MDVYSKVDAILNDRDVFFDYEIYHKDATF